MKPAAQLSQLETSIEHEKWGLNAVLTFTYHWSACGQIRSGTSSSYKRYSSRTGGKLPTTPIEAANDIIVRVDPESDYSYI
jgi:hypothetical protein